MTVTCRDCCKHHCTQRDRTNCWPCQPQHTPPWLPHRHWHHPWWLQSAMGHCWRVLLRWSWFGNWIYCVRLFVIVSYLSSFLKGLCAKSQNEGVRHLFAPGTCSLSPQKPWLFGPVMIVPTSLGSAFKRGIVGPKTAFWAPNLPLGDTWGPFKFKRTVCPIAE